MKRKHKNYSRPKRPFDKERIVEENKIKEEFGLKNKKEIWKADAKISVIRTQAKKLINASEDEKDVLFNKLKKVGLNVNSIADVLALTKNDILSRRLQTVLVTKKLARTVKGARQLITHKKVLIDGNVINVPSYIVPVELESKINLKVQKIKKSKIEEKKEEIIDEEIKPKEIEEKKE